MYNSSTCTKHEAMAESLSYEELQPLLNEIVAEEGIKNATIKVSSIFREGTGFIGYPHNLKIVHDCGELNLMVKAAPSDRKYRDQLFVRAHYLNEIYFYEKIVPNLKAFQKERGVEACAPFPKYYGSVKADSSEALVLEDLRSSGYNIRQFSEVTPADVRFIFGQYAKFHAVSFGMKDKRPDLFARIAGELFGNMVRFHEDSQLTQSIYEQCLKIEKEFEKESFASRLRDFRKDVLRKTLDDYEYFQDQFSVITHGDTWINNIMLKSEDSVTCDLRFIDFQRSRIGSVVQDLSYIFYTCCPKEEMDRLEEYLEHYHKTLSEEVKRLGCDIDDIFTYQQLQHQWKKYSTYGLTMAIVVLHGLNAERHEFPDFAKVLREGGNIFIALNFTSKNESVYLERIKDVIEHFVRNNFI